MVGEPEDWRSRLVIGNDTLKDVDGDYRVTEPGSDRPLLEGRYHAPANSNVPVGTLPVSHSDHRLLLLRWTVDRKEHGSHYLLGKPPFSLGWYRSMLPAIAALPRPFDFQKVGR